MSIQAIARRVCIWSLTGLFVCTPVMVQAHTADHQDLLSDPTCVTCLFKSQLQMDNPAISPAEGQWIVAFIRTEKPTTAPTHLPERARARSPPRH